MGTFIKSSIRMKKEFRIAIQVTASVIIIMMLYVCTVIILNESREYRPENSPLPCKVNGEKADTLSADILSILSWNTGYGGLGEEADFFYEGGDMVYPSKEESHAYFKGILNKISSYDSVDLILLQEVDLSSRRSNFIDQHDQISRQLKNHQGLFAKNYDVIYIPIPLFRPLSKVRSGLSFFTRYTPEEAGIIVFPGNYPWPKKLFTPDRLFLYCAYILPSGKKLYVINTHNSAFDDGSLRRQQIEILWTYMQQWHEEGNYVIAGGDWNVNPRGYQNNTFESGDVSFSVPYSWENQIDDPDWTFAFDNQYPTNRDVSGKYLHAHSPTTIIDYFVCSPNIEILALKTHHDGFQFSDHQAVYMRLRLCE